MPPKPLAAVSPYPVAPIAAERQQVEHDAAPHSARRLSPPAIGPPDRVAFTIEEACRCTGVGRSFLYAEMKAGRLAAVKAGKRTLLLRDELQRWLGTMPCYQPRPQAAA